MRFPFVAVERASGFSIFFLFFAPLGRPRREDGGEGSTLESSTSSGSETLVRSLLSSSAIQWTENAGHEEVEWASATDDFNEAEDVVESAAPRRGRPRPRFGTTLGGGSTAALATRGAVSKEREEEEEEEGGGRDGRGSGGRPRPRFGAGAGGLVAAAGTPDEGKIVEPPLLASLRFSSSSRMDAAATDPMSAVVSLVPFHSFLTVVP